MGKKINIIEVGPRDGFQSVKTDCCEISTELKKEIIDGLFGAGIRQMEYSSFVSPKAIPQLADAAEVTKYVLETYGDRDVFPLVPNFRGAENAHANGVKKIVYVVSMSKSHNKANINRSHEESLEEFKKIKEAFPDMKIIVDLATAFGCPFEGKYRDTDMPVRFLKDYVDAGMDCCCLCDTIGIADPEQVKQVIGKLKQAYPSLHLMVHFHDTRGLGMSNSFAAIEAGITDIQSALGGLGGCPFAPGASGNLATEDVVWALQECGYETGIDFEKLLAVAKMQCAKINGVYSGHQRTIEAA